MGYSRPSNVQPNDTHDPVVSQVQGMGPGCACRTVLKGKHLPHLSDACLVALQQAFGTPVFWKHGPCRVMLPIGTRFPLLRKHALDLRVLPVRKTGVHFSGSTLAERWTEGVGPRESRGNGAASLRPCADPIGKIIERHRECAVSAVDPGQACLGIESPHV